MKRYYTPSGASTAAGRDRRIDAPTRL